MYCKTRVWVWFGRKPAFKGCPVYCAIVRVAQHHPQEFAVYVQLGGRCSASHHQNNPRKTQVFRVNLVWWCNGDITQVTSAIWLMLHQANQHWDGMYQLTSFRLLNCFFINLLWASYVWILQLWSSLSSLCADFAVQGHQSICMLYRIKIIEFYLQFWEISNMQRYLSC